jgi:hypothetical protein
VIELVGEPLHEALQLDEVEHIVSLGIEPAFHHDPHAVVVTVQRLATVPGEGDEVGGGEDEVVLRHRDVEYGARAIHRALKLMRPATRRLHAR